MITPLNGKERAICNCSAATLALYSPTDSGLIGALECFAIYYVAAVTFSVFATAKYVDRRGEERYIPIGEERL